MYVYNKDTLIAKYEDGVLQAVYTPDRILAHKLKPTLSEFLTSRVMPKHNWDVLNAAEFYGIPHWDPYAICKLTHGYMPADFIWCSETQDLDWATVQKQEW